MFIDASALIAVIAMEPDADFIAGKLETAQNLMISPIAFYESCLGLAQARKLEVEAAERQVTALLKVLNVQVIGMTEEIGQKALQAHVRFGKGRHKASLNMGDCFAYACAKTHRVPLLCKGDDFILTDIELA